MAHRRYVLACVIFIFCRVDGETLYGLKGLSVSLKPNIPDKPKDILWKHNDNILVEFNGKKQQVYGKYKNRITLDWHTAEIVITDLRFEDSGKYELEVTINNKLHWSFKTLVIIDEVPEPTISCKMNDGSSSNKSGTLECSAESKDSQTQSLMKFQWESRGNVQPGPQLTISLGDEHDDHVYTCNVSNPLSSKTTTFTAKDCYPDESSSGALAAGIVIPILLIFVVLAIVFCRRNQKACFAVKGDEPPPGSTEKPAKKEDPSDEPADLQENEIPHQESSTAPEEPGSDQTTAQDEENKPLLDKAAADQPTEGRDPDNLSTNGKGEADEDQDREPAKKEGRHCDSSDCEKENEPDQADVSADTDSHPEPSSTASKESGYVNFMKRRFDGKHCEKGSDQTTAQDEENTDEATTDQQPDRKLGYVNSVKMRFDRKHCEKDQTTAQDEENSDDATTDQQPDRKLGYVKSVKRMFQ